MTQKLLFVVGARPNFMKIAPIIDEVIRFPSEFSYQLIHTGQHYDENMSRIFFDELGMPKPDIDLEVGSGSHAQQTAEIMRKIEPIFFDYQPDFVVVPGDVNSTLAASLVASKLGVKIVHVEAGLRSNDRSMPEEINRLVTDQISDLLLTPSRDGNENLEHEGISADKVHFVGNVMIDSLVRLLPQAKNRWTVLQQKYDLERYLLVTLHRPFNVDTDKSLHTILSALHEISTQVQVIFPVHPRTQKRIEQGNYAELVENILLLEPLGYLDFLAMQAHAAAVLTDSGGVQEETTYLGVPCLTARPNTERPITITQGTNQLINIEQDPLLPALNKLLSDPVDSHAIPEYWDGRASQRIVELLLAQAAA